MLKRIDSNTMGSSHLGWLNSTFHFSFADYYNPQNINFGVLRVINDDLIEAGTGFDTHPHKNMEIISYVVNGELTHIDSMENKRALTRGQVQYMSAGTGVFHSEHNLSHETLRILQIWILPSENNLEPNYGDRNFKWDGRKNKWLQIVTGQSIENSDENSPIKIYQDVNIFVTEIEKDKDIDFKVSVGRQAYIVQIEGSSNINNTTLLMRDGMEVVEEDLNIKAIENSHVMVLEMKKAL